MLRLPQGEDGATRLALTFYGVVGVGCGPDGLYSLFPARLRKAAEHGHLKT